MKLQRDDDRQTANSNYYLNPQGVHDNTEETLNHFLKFGVCELRTVVKIKTKPREVCSLSCRQILKIVKSFVF